MAMTTTNSNVGPASAPGISGPGSLAVPSSSSSTNNGGDASLADHQIMALVNDVLKIAYLEEAFNCVIVHQPSAEEETIRQFHRNFVQSFGALPPDQKKLAIQQFLRLASSRTSLHQIKYLLGAIQQLIAAASVQSRLVCEQILACDRLVYSNQPFWLECFGLIRQLIATVDYKGVREIMKGCRDKIQTFPYHIGPAILPQLLAAEQLLEHIFDRTASLLPAYFIANEMQKIAPIHWKIAGMTAAFVEDFRDIAQMVSIVGHSQMRPIVEHFGYTEACVLPWRLDCSSLKLNIKGILPFDADLLQPQTGLLKYVLEQPYSKDMVCSMLNLQKQCKIRCEAIEEQLVDLIMTAMERAEREMPAASATGAEAPDDGQNPLHWLWLHISSQLIYFMLFGFATFPTIVAALHERLARRELRRGRDYLMWTLLQFVSGSIHRNPLSSFLSVLGLYDTLYPEREALPVPDCTKPYCSRQMAPTCIWFHLMKKAQSDSIVIQRPMPVTLKKHHEFLTRLALNSSGKPIAMGNDYTVFLMCNAYSTHPEFFARPMAALVESINKYANGGGAASVGGGPPVTSPLPTVTLDCLTVHAKMSLIHNIVSYMIKQAQLKPTSVTALDPATAETYSRLLVYTEIESLGIKTFLTQLLPAVFKSQAWAILHTLLEMVSYRMHHIQPFYRVQLLSHLHSLVSVPQTNLMQLFVCIETTALRLINGLGSAEVQPQLSRFCTENKAAAGTAVAVDNEELNRALILSIAHSMHITGSGGNAAAAAASTEDNSSPNAQQPIWCKELLDAIVQHTPHSWSQHTLQCFPPSLAAYFAGCGVQRENKALLKKLVEEEWRNWSSMGSEGDILAHFGGPGAATGAVPSGVPPVQQSLVLCIVFRMLLESDAIAPVAFKVLERIGARALSAHLRRLCDYLVYEVTYSQHHAPTHINNCVEALNAMVWKHSLFSIDRLILTLSLRPLEPKEAHVCFFIMQMLLLKTADFRQRVTEFVADNEPDHWRQSNWHEKHTAFHVQFREKFVPDECAQAHVPVLPVYFGNVCLRFVPVLDMMIHRFLEVPLNNANKTLEVILDQLGCLYKFHDRPITYLYQTLHFYEVRLRERPTLKRRLVAVVTNAFKGIRPESWALTGEYRKKYAEPAEAEALLWVPDIKYYMTLFRRFVGAMTGKDVFYLADWRFNEFPNAVAHAMYATCVELLSLPGSAATVANSIIDVIVLGFPIIPHREIHDYINAVGIVLTALPECYWSCVYERLHDALVSAKMLQWPFRQTPFEMFNFRTVNEAMLERSFVSLLAVAHAVLHHSSTGQIATLADYIKDKLKPAIQTEQQLIYLCHLFAPFMGRLDQERARVGYELTTLLYEILEQVDKHLGTAPLRYMDPICDLLYHIKYMFVGDIVKNESETIIRRLRPALQMRLRFITHLNVDEIASDATGNNAGDRSQTAGREAMDTTPAGTIGNAPNSMQQLQQQLQQQQQMPQISPNAQHQMSAMQQQQQHQLLQQQQQQNPQQQQQLLQQQQMLQQQMLQQQQQQQGNMTPQQQQQQMLPQQSPQQMQQQQHQPNQNVQQQQQMLQQQLMQQQMLQQQQQQQQPNNQQQMMQQMQQQQQFQQQMQHQQQMQQQSMNANRQH